MPVCHKKREINKFKMLFACQVLLCGIFVVNIFKGRLKCSPIKIFTTLPCYFVMAKIIFREWDIDYYVHKTTAIHWLLSTFFFISWQNEQGNNGRNAKHVIRPDLFLSTLSEIAIWTPCGKPLHIFFQLISKPSTRHLYCWTSITCVRCIWLQKSLSPILQWKCLLEV